MSPQHSSHLPATRSRLSRRAVLRSTAAGGAVALAWPGWARAQERDEIVTGHQAELTGINPPYGDRYEKTLEAVVERADSTWSARSTAPRPSTR
jgi:hypothetical protein